MGAEVDFNDKQRQQQSISHFIFINNTVVRVEITLNGYRFIFVFDCTKIVENGK